MEDLQDPRILDHALQLARNIWIICQLNFLRRQKDKYFSKITAIGTVLIEYYDGIIDAILNGKEAGSEEWVVYTTDTMLLTSTNRNVHMGPESSLRNRLDGISKREKMKIQYFDIKKSDFEFIKEIGITFDSSNFLKNK